jgi:hypothetical protein
MMLFNPENPVILASYRQATGGMRVERVFCACAVDSLPKQTNALMH